MHMCICAPMYIPVCRGTDLIRGSFSPMCWVKVNQS